MNVLRKLEEAWTVYLGQRRVERNLESLPVSQPPPPGPDPYRDDSDEDEDEPLMDQQQQNGNDHAVPYGRARPKAIIRFGFLRIRSRKVDAIEYYEDVLAGLDEKIKTLRKEDFEPMPLAFVTMDSVASCVSLAFHFRMPRPLIQQLYSKWQYKRCLTHRLCNSSPKSAQLLLMLSGAIPTCQDGNE